MYKPIFICRSGYNIIRNQVLQFCFQSYFKKTQLYNVCIATGHYIAEYLTELFLVSLWTFSKGTQWVKAWSWVKCIQKRRKYEPEGSKQWRKFWPSVNLLHIFMWDSTFKAQNFPGVLGLLTVTASQSHRSPGWALNDTGGRGFPWSFQGKQFNRIPLYICAFSDVFLPFYPSNTREEQSWRGVRWLKTRNEQIQWQGISAGCVWDVEGEVWRCETWSQGAKCHQPSHRWEKRAARALLEMGVWAAPRWDSTHSLRLHSVTEGPWPAPTFPTGSREGAIQAFGVEKLTANNKSNDAFVQTEKPQTVKTKLKLELSQKASKRLSLATRDIFL